MIPIQHKRIAFKYAVTFISNEMESIENTLSQANLLDKSVNLLQKRLTELESDLLTLESYSLHD